MNALSEERQSEFQRLIDEASAYLSHTATQSIHSAYSMLLSRLGEDFDSRDAFIQKSVDVAIDLSDLGLDVEYIVASLLDLLVCTKYIDVDEIGEVFGQKVSKISNVLSKLSRNLEAYLPWNRLVDDLYTPAEKKHLREKKTEFSAREITTITDGIITIAESTETLMVKLVDRLHLAKRSASILPDKELATLVARENIALYATIAEMVGVWSVKWQLEDYSFRIVDPEDYQMIVSDIDQTREERDAKIERAISILKESMKLFDLKADITGRAKHIYGIYQKIKQTGQSVRQVNDVLGIRVIVNTVEQCYVALDILFATWTPADGVYGKDKLIRDWIAAPKENNYQSIHTTVVFEGQLLEVQIRTATMHDRAEYGIAAHWIYRRVGNSSRAQQKFQKRGVNRISDIRHEIEDWMNINKQNMDSND